MESTVNEELDAVYAAIAEEDTKIGQCYLDMGQLYASMHEEDHEPEFDASFAAIAEAKAKIEEYEEQSRNLRGVILCPECGEETPAEQTFCNSCGIRLKPEEIVEDNSPKCPNCGHPVEEGVPFCTECGTPLHVPALQPVEEMEDDKIICTSCQAELKADMRFCAYCGKPMAEILEDIFEKLRAEEEAKKAEEEAAAKAAEEEANAPLLCPHCNAELVENARFCSFCGSPAPVNPAPSGKMKKCAMCGTELPAEKSFCTECGSRMLINITNQG